MNKTKINGLNLFNAKAFLKFKFLSSRKACVDPQSKHSDPFFLASHIGTSDRIIWSSMKNKIANIKMERTAEICQIIRMAFLSSWFFENRFNNRN